MSRPGPTNGDDGAALLPEALRAQCDAEGSGSRILAVAAYDLDTRAMYVDGWLILTPERLVSAERHEGEWRRNEIDLADIRDARIIEGVGLSLLRLVADAGCLGEFKFTLRHAKEVARLHRRLQRLVDRDEAPGEETARGADGEKKLRCDKCGRVIPAWSEVCPACLSRRKVLSRLFDFVKPYKWRAAGGVLLAVLVTASVLARPYLTKPMLDRGLGMGRGYEADYGVLLGFVGILAGLTILAAVAEAFRERLLATLGSRISRDIRDRTYEHLHRLSLSFFSKKPTGSLVTRVTSDSDRIWDFVAFTIVEVLISFMTIGGVGLALFLLDWKLAGFVLLPIPVMIGLTFWFHKRLHRGFLRLFHLWSQMTAIVSDALPGVRVIKAFSREKREVRRFRDKNSDFYDDEVGMIMLWTLFRPVMQFCSQVGTLLVWLIGGYRVVHGDLSPGTLVAFNGYMWMFYGPIHMIAHMDRMFNRAATSVQRIFEILDTEPTVFSPADAHPVGRLDGRIELRNVSFTYDGVRRVLKHVDLKIAPGEMIGLAGPSGGGKTTMVNLICRFYDVLEGTILIDGIDVRQFDVEALRRRIGVVLQEPFLFHGTVAGNIAFGKPDASLEEIIEAARAANAHEFILRFPDAYDTLVGERGHTLSGGERQRISIARAILNDPAILILDEATSSVDTETERQIQDALDRLIANRTTIAIAHRLSTLNKADRLVILDKGEIVEQGSHDELLQLDGGTYARLVRLQNELQSVMAIS